MDVSWGGDRKGGDRLQPGNDVNEVKDVTGAVSIPSTDWVDEWLEREGAGVEGSCVGWMRGILFAAVEVSEAKSEWDWK
jgi:hypothetical protein